MKLLIVSDTGLYTKDETARAFGPVVKEVEYFLKEYDQITWIGFERPDQENNKSYLNVDKRVKIVALPRLGGRGIYDKIKIIWHYPIMFFIIMRWTFRHNYIHVRAPSHPAVVAMFISYFFKKKKFWFKYAGSWIDPASSYYELQRGILKRLNNHCKITVNGDWNNTNKNILAFENPCLNGDDRRIGDEIMADKSIDTNINFCFVGALNEHKGVDSILEAFEDFSKDSNIGRLDLVGSGVDIEKFKEKAKALKIAVKFHGFLKKSDILKIYRASHFIILPSKSEGFPKVIGEAMNYGCVPIVSNVSCIDQYIIDESTGYLIQPNTPEVLQQIIRKVLLMNNEKFKLIIKENYNLAGKFTYSNYMNRIKELIF